MRDFEGVGQGGGKFSRPAELVLGYISYWLSPVGPAHLAVVTRVAVCERDGAAVTVPGVALQGFEL